MAPLAFMRGRTLSDSLHHILDEAQNTMKMSSRVGVQGPCVTGGGEPRSTCPQQDLSGLVEVERSCGTGGSGSCTSPDRRGAPPLVSDIIKAYNHLVLGRRNGKGE